MAATWVAPIVGITWASTKVMAFLVNASGSGKVLRVYRIRSVNYASAAVTAAAMPVMELHKVTAVGTPSTVTCVAHDTASSALPGQVTAGSASTHSSSFMYRRVFTTPDECPAVGATWATSAITQQMGWTVLFDAGYGANGDGREPFVLREGEGLTIYTSAGGSVGTRDFYIEFTVT